MEKTDILYATVIVWSIHYHCWTGNILKLIAFPFLACVRPVRVSGPSGCV